MSSACKILQMGIVIHSELAVNNIHTVGMVTVSNACKVLQMGIVIQSESVTSMLLAWQLCQMPASLQMGIVIQPKLRCQ